jgi:RNA polymerase sigma factor (sigma-70 family)
MESQAPPDDIGSLLRHSDWLRNLARGLIADQAAADDLVQETWLVAMKTPPNPARPARPWLAGVLRNLVRMRARAEGRRSWRQKASAKKDELPSTIDLIEHVDTQRQLAELVLELREPYRSTLLLHYYQDIPAVEIARRQDIPAGTVRWRLKQGIDDLRGRLDRRYSDRHSWCLALGSLTTGLRETSSAGPLALASAGSLLIFARLGAIVAVLALLSWIPWSDLREALAAESVSGAAPLVSADEMAAVEGQDLAQLAPVAQGSVEHEAITPAALASPGLLGIRVLAHDGTPERNRRTVLLREDGQFEPQRTDKNGWVRFAPSSGSGDFLVEGRASFPVHMPVALAASEQLLQLDSGSELSGRLLVDGLPPDPPVTLRITTNHPILEHLDVPPEVWKLLAFGRLARAQTDAEGEFHFIGLDAAWKGMLILPDDIVREGRRVPEYGGPRIHVEGPRRGLLIRTESLPHITGRVLEADGGIPVAAAHVTCEISGAAGVRSRMEAHADADGRFELTLRGGSDFALAHIEFAGPEGRGRRTLEFERADLPKTLDVGDLELAHTRSVSFQAITTSGEPIAGARASAEDNPTMSEPTDTQGKSTAFGLPVDASSLELRARGYRVARVALADPESDIVVTMHATNVLTILVLDREGGPVKDASVRIQCDEPLFLETGTHKPDSLLRSQHVGRWRAARSRSQGPHILKADDEGRISLQGVTSSADLQLQVIDLLGDVLIEQSIAALGKTEEREHTAQVDFALHTLLGSIHDEKDQPVVGAEVVLIGDSGERLHSRANVDGDFRYEDLRASSVHFEVAKRGYAQLVFDDLALDGEPIDLILEHGHDVVVQVFDSAGNSVPGGRVAVTQTDSPATWNGNETATGRFEVNGLPGQVMHFSLHLGGVHYQKSHDAQAGGLTFEVPLHAPLHVNWSLPRGRRPGADYELLLRSSEDGHSPMTLRVQGAAGRATFPAVQPGSYQLSLQRHGAGSVAGGELLVRRAITQQASGSAEVSIEP